MALVFIDVDGLVRGGVHIQNRTLLLFTAGNSYSSCGVCDLFLVLCAKYIHIYTPVGTAVYSVIKKRYLQNRNTSNLIRVTLLFVLMSFPYVFVFAIICSS